MDREEFFGILCKVKGKQKVGQHLQCFMEEIHNELSGLVEGKIPDRLFIRAVLRGLTPSILIAMPLMNQPWTVEQLLWFGDNLRDFLPATDPHWETEPRTAHPGPDFSITVPNEEYVPIYCYRCGESGHKATGCSNPRLNYLRPKNSKRKNKARKTHINKNRKCK